MLLAEHSSAQLVGKGMDEVANLYDEMVSAWVQRVIFPMGTHYVEGADYLSG
jgi:hypothetical protein